MIRVQSLIFNLFLVVAVIASVFLLGFLYKSQLSDFFFGDEKISVTIRDTAVTASVADSPEERSRGLSGVESLKEQEGMLFIFDRTGYYGFWMKDMLIPLDIIWIDEDSRVVHIEEDVRPETYPTIYNSVAPARFVLEVNAFFARTFNIQEGDTVTIPADHLPDDLRQR